MKFLIIVMISAFLLPIPVALAQDLPPMELPEKKHYNMDSELTQLYEAETIGSPSTSSTQSPQVGDAPRVKVILVMISEDAPIPQNLGIEVETTYENLVQATVPVRNLEAIASDENVDFVRMPHRPIPTVVQPVTDSESIELPNDLRIKINHDEIQPVTDSDPIELAYLFVIPAIAAPIIIGALVYQKKIANR